ncbi:draxin-B isoform X2 [Brienomyrus brachyistius]|uniref:draxin-B isoform X2 n=1 Tax=Brienomyrus brachyistius TaxID=42636 RepID=UPI0020B3D6C9|nr:draxin-B isoform X2 [Brienomyrus brachyistius]
MPFSVWGLSLAVILAALAVSHGTQPASSATKESTVPSSGNTNALQNMKTWVQEEWLRSRHGWPRPFQLMGPIADADDDGAGLEGLEPVKLERGPPEAPAETESGFLGAWGPQHTLDDLPPGSEGSVKGWRRHRHRAGHRRLAARKSKNHHVTERSREVLLPLELKEVGGLQEQLPWTAPSDASKSPTTPTPTPTIVSSSISLVTTVTCEEPLVLPPASTRPQKPSPVRGVWKTQAEVTPTLDMALFDWTDYEDLRPADTWRSSKKKDRQHSKSLGGGNKTTDMETCDHHTDCGKGSCCDLRRHVCTQHNRGLNNKCYDDCMCDEGFRCYAKFHRKRRVTRRKGRCVDPESVNQGKGAFITI